MLARLLQSSLFRTASIYGAANMLRQAVPVLLVPVLTRHLSPADYGMTAVFGVLVAVLTPVIGVNVHGAISRKYFDREEVEFPVYVFNCMLVVAASAVPVALVLWLGGEWISAFSEVPAGWLWAAALVAMAQTVINSMMVLLQVQGKAVSYGAIQVGRTALIACATVVFVVAIGFDWRGAVLGQVLGAVVFMAVTVVFLVRGRLVRSRVHPEYVRHAVGFGLPLVPHTLSAVAVQTIDRLFVTHYVGLAQTGVYSLGYQLGALIGLLEDSFNRAFQPWLFEQLKRGDFATKRKIVLFTYGYFVAIAVIALALGLVAPWILSFLVPERFQGAYVHVPWIALGFAFSGMYKMVSGYLFFAERTGVLAWVTFVSAGANIALNFLLVPRFGALGSAYATAGSFLLSFVLSWIAAARVYPMPWSLRAPR